MRTTSVAITAGLASLAFLAACGESSVDVESSGTVRIVLTDAPADYLATAEVCLSSVYLQPSDDDGSEDETGGTGAQRIVLWEKGEGEAQCFDLLELQGVGAQVSETTVPAGTYAQLRFVVESATVTLAEGYTFNDGETTTMPLKVPSGARSGIKVTLLEPVQVEARTVTDVTVDADVNANFVLQGNPETPAGIHGVLFTPSLKETEPGAVPPVG